MAAAAATATSGTAAGADEGAALARRGELRNALGALTEVEALSNSAFLLSSASVPGAGKALVDVQLVKPALSSEAKGPLLELVRRSLLEETPGAWFANDRFSKKTLLGACDAVVEIVFPADGRDVAKRKTKALRRLRETPQLYATVTVPKYIVQAEKRDAWVANIIQGRKEQEHVVTELGCDQILVVKDYKWQDTSNVDNLYYLAMFKDLSVRSLRDLRGDQHLKALHRLQRDIVPGLAAKHGVPVDQLLAYIHYHPTFWYFHVHVVSCKHAMFSGEGSQNLLLSAMDRFHKVETVISLLEANSEYYRDAVLPILLPPHQLPWFETAPAGLGEDEPATKRAKA